MTTRDRTSGVATAPVADERTRREAGLETRAALLDAAVALFGSRGYSETSVREVVALAGVTKGAFYHHFGGKLELLIEIHDRFIVVFADRIDEILARQLDPSATLALLIEESVELVGRYELEIAVFLEARRVIPESELEHVRRERKAFADRWIGVLEDGAALGEFRPLAEPRVFAFGLIGMCAWAYTWFRPSGLSGRDIGRMYADVIVRGLRASPDWAGPPP